jgi:hypothetical protein
MRRYSIDTSAILDGWVRYYPPDVMPPLWETLLVELIEADRLLATEEVLYELAKKDDGAHGWAKKQARMFVPIDAPTQVAVAEILGKFERLVNTQKNRSAVDPFVIALAKTLDATVITGEKPSGSLERPRIPDVCRAMGVPCFSLLDLFRAEGWRFGLTKT